MAVNDKAGIIILSNGFITAVCVLTIDVQLYEAVLITELLPLDA